MQKPSLVLTVSFASLLSLVTAGCTLYPEKKPPTLATTTSAEQHERILWQLVQKQQWNKISPLFSTTLVWSVDGKPLDADQTVGYLKSLKINDAIVRDATAKPNGQDMTITYTLQISGPDGAVQNYAVFSIWQQLKGGGYVLIAHSQQTAPPSAAASAAR